MKINFFLSIVLLILCISLPAQDNPEKITRVAYKKIDGITLNMEIHYPPGMDKNKSLPAMVFFFGGGWKGGTLMHFEPHARYFAERGLITITVDYRVEKRNNTTPFESLKDAKSAMRFVRANAKDLGIDPEGIIASGGSAGGHLAAATALISEFNEAGEDLSVSCKPSALVLFNPVIDNGPAGYGYERIGESYKEFSPLHNIREGAPPTVIFLGTKDVLIPVETARYYQKAMQRVKSRCDLFLYEDQTHGFFNYQHQEYYRKTVKEADSFLVSLGYLEPLPED